MKPTCVICGQEFEANNELDAVTLLSQHLFFVHNEKEFADKVLMKAIQKNKKEESLAELQMKFNQKRFKGLLDNAYRRLSNRKTADYDSAMEKWLVACYVYLTSRFGSDEILKDLIRLLEDIESKSLLEAKK